MAKVIEANDIAAKEFHVPRITVINAVSKP
jgi:hypothetical protein